MLCPLRFSRRAPSLAVRKIRTDPFRRYAPGRRYPGPGAKGLSRLDRRAVDAAGLSVSFLDLDQVYRDQGAGRECRARGFDLLPFETINEGTIRPRAILTQNDWEPNTRRIIQAAKRAGIVTIGLVEGVQDYPDKDTGRLRFPYRTVDHVILPGLFDARYFKGRQPTLHTGAVPRIGELLAAGPTPFPKTPLVVINVNFINWLLNGWRTVWLDAVVAACEALGYDWIVTRHPGDAADLSGYNVADESMYDLIARRWPAAG